MAYQIYTKDPIGIFTEKDTGNYFEFSLNDDMDMPEYYKFPHKVWVGGDRIGGDQGYRYAEVKSTVAYIVTDEDENGPVIEKWKIKGLKEYAI